MYQSARVDEWLAPEKFQTLAYMLKKMGTSGYSAVALLALGFNFPGAVLVASCEYVRRRGRRVVREVVGQVAEPADSEGLADTGVLKLKSPLAPTSRLKLMFQCGPTLGVPHFWATGMLEKLRALRRRTCRYTDVDPQSDDYKRLRRMFRDNV